MIIAFASADDRIRLIAIEMKGAFGNEGALPLFEARDLCAKRLLIRLQVFHPGVAQNSHNRLARPKLFGHS
jgi:hypothetical protein